MILPIPDNALWIPAKDPGSTFENYRLKNIWHIIGSGV